MKNKQIILAQVVFLVLVLGLVYFVYPKAELSINGNAVKFNSENVNYIIISENPDFSNPRYIDLSNTKNILFRLKPGVYYWKPVNSVISGFEKKFVINSKVSLGVKKNETDTNLVNLGNVKLNVTKNKGGVMVGHIILEPETSKKLEEDKGKYIGREIE